MANNPAYKQLGELIVEFREKKGKLAKNPQPMKC